MDHCDHRGQIFKVAELLYFPSLCPRISFSFVAVFPSLSAGICFRVVRRILSSGLLVAWSEKKKMLVNDAFHSWQVLSLSSGQGEPNSISS